MILFLGAPGAGKGTQARLLANRCNYKIFSVGEILRDEIRNSSEIGKIVKKSNDEGNFASIDLVVDLLKSRVDSHNYVLDGYPRDVAQAEALDELISNDARFDASKLLVLDFIMSSAELLNRLSRRVLCHHCNASLSKEDEKCLFCGAMVEKSYVREDDRHEIIINRIKKFEEEIEKLREFYKNKCVYNAINAEESMEKVFDQVRYCINKKNLV